MSKIDAVKKKPVDKAAELPEAMYGRVSTDDQSLASQLPDLERYAKALDRPPLWFKDHFTGKTMERPGMESLLGAIRAGKVSKVVVWRLDRLGRTAKGLLDLLEECQRLNVGIVSIREGFDLATPVGRLMFGILASMAAYETEVRGERARAGIAAKIAKGQKWGGSKKGRVTRKVKEAMMKVHNLASKGIPIAIIAREVGLSRNKVYQILRAPTQ